MTAAVLKEELSTAGLATVYFFACFLLVMALKRLFLAQYDIAFYGLSVAFFGALVVGKVVVVLDKTGAGQRFEQRRSPLLAALYKTLVYTLVALVVVVLEKLLHASRHAPSLTEAALEVWQERDRNHILATVLVLAPSFGGYNLYSAIDRGLAGGQLMAWLLGLERRDP